MRRDDAARPARRARPAGAASCAVLTAAMVTIAGCGDSSAGRATGPRGTPSPDTGPQTTAAARVPKAAPVSCPPATVTVHDAAGLQTALSAARAGTVITLADGTYVGQFVATARATAARPIYLCGTRQAVLDGGDVRSGSVLRLDGARSWRLEGFTVRNAQKGVVLDRTSGSVVDRLDVGHTGEEGIHLRTFSTSNAVQYNVVHDTGLVKAKFGEGIYVGSAKSNWCRYTGCDADRSNANLIRGNTIARTTAESVDIKEGTTGGVLQGNSFDAAGMSAADSWVDVKGNGWQVIGNTGTRSAGSSIVDGYQTHRILSGWGTGTVFTANTGTLSASGYGFHLAPVAGNVVRCDNDIAGAGRGLTNTRCEP